MHFILLTSLILLSENIVLQKIASDKFDVGTTAKLNCKLVAGYEPINIRWSKELDERSLTHMKVEGFKLVIENIRMKDSGNYTCYVNNSFSESSLTFHVYVYGMSCHVCCLLIFYICCISITSKLFNSTLH